MFVFIWILQNKIKHYRTFFNIFPSKTSFSSKKYFKIALQNTFSKQNQIYIIFLYIFSQNPSLQNASPETPEMKLEIPYVFKKQYILQKAEKCRNYRSFGCSLKLPKIRNKLELHACKFSWKSSWNYTLINYVNVWNAF